MDIFKTKGDTLLPTLTSSWYYIFEAYELKQSGDCLVASWPSRLFITLYHCQFFFETFDNNEWVSSKWKVIRYPQRLHHLRIIYLKLMSWSNRVIDWCLPGVDDVSLRYISSSSLRSDVMSGYLQEKKWYATPITYIIFKWYIGSFGAEEIGWLLFGVFLFQPTFHYTRYHRRSKGDDERWERELRAMKVATIHTYE